MYEITGKESKSIACLAIMLLAIALALPYFTLAAEAEKPVQYDLGEVNAYEAELDNEQRQANSAGEAQQPDTEALREQAKTYEEILLDESDLQHLDEFGKIETKIMRIIDHRNPLKTIFVIALEDIILKHVDQEFFFSDQNLTILQERALSAVRESKLLFANELMLTEYPTEIVDKRVVELISSLQKKGVPIIIITSNTSGKLNKIPYLEQWTVELLKKHGIDLSAGQFAGIRLIMDKYSSKERGAYPSFFDGLLSCSTHKGKNAQQNIFTTLLVRFGFKPATVIMLHHDENILKVTKEQLSRIKKDLEYWDFKFVYGKQEFNNQQPEEFIKFWKEYARKLNAVSRGPSDSDAGNPYEEE